MTDDKPKHKPQAKRTLEEVLRSLKDLVRHDLTGQRSASPAGSRPIASDEPESFNEALSRLDAIIDEKIVRPARTAPPAAPQPAADDIDIDWDEVAEPQDEDGDALPPPAGAAASTPDADERDPAAVDDGADYRLAPEADDTAELPDANAADLAALDAIELAPIAPEAPRQDQAFGVQAPTDHPSGLQEAFSFLQSEGPLDQTPASAEQALRVGADTQAVGAQADVSDPSGLDWIGPSNESPDDPATGAGDGMPTVATAPMPGDSHDHDLRFEPDPPDPQSPAMSAEGRNPGQTAPRPDAGTDDAGSGSGDAPMSRTAEPARRSHASPSDGAEPPTLEEEIPVLQDVAPGQPAGAAALPDAAHARDIAIRVIARINIERRKAGETPLDIKTIERLQRYLTEALTRAAAGRIK